MASMNNPLEDDDELKQSTTAQSGVIGAGGPNESKAQQSSWTNLQSYLDANKGQGGGVADATLKNTSDEIKAVGEGINSWQTDAKKKVDDSTRKDSYSNTIKNGSLDDVAKMDKNEFSAWKGLSNYWGANDASEDQGYADVYNKSKATEDKIKNANSWEGQQVLAKDTFGKEGRYTDGMGLLDTFVARQDAPQKYEAFQTENKDFGNKIKDASAGFNTYKDGAAARGQKAYDDTLSAISGRQASLANTAKERGYNEQGRQFDSAQRQIQQQFQNAGLDAPESTLDYLSPNAAFNGNSFYSKAEEDALNSLAGIDNDASTGNLVRGSSSAYTRDVNKISSDIAGTKAERARVAEQERLRREAEAAALAIDAPGANGVRK